MSELMFYLLERGSPSGPDDEFPSTESTSMPARLAHDQNILDNHSGQLSPDHWSQSNVNIFPDEPEAVPKLDSPNIGRIKLGVSATDPAVGTALAEYRKSFTNAARTCRFESNARGEDVPTGIINRMLTKGHDLDCTLYCAAPGRRSWMQEATVPLDPDTCLVLVQNIDLTLIAVLGYLARIPVEIFLSHAGFDEPMPRIGQYPAEVSLTLDADDFLGSTEHPAVRMSCFEVRKGLEFIFISDIQFRAEPTLRILTNPRPPEIVLRHDWGGSNDWREDEKHGDWPVISVGPGDRGSLLERLHCVASNLFEEDPKTSIQGDILSTLNQTVGLTSEDRALILFQLLILEDFHLKLQERDEGIRLLDFAASTSPNAGTLAALASYRRDLAQIRARTRDILRPEMYSNLKLDVYDRGVLGRRESSDRKRTKNVRTLAEILKGLDDHAARLVVELNEINALLIPAITIQDTAFMRTQAERATTLTILAAIYLPLTLVTGIFGMNIKEIGEAAPPWWTSLVALAVIISITLLIFMVLRYWKRIVRAVFMPGKVVELSIRWVNFKVKWSGRKHHWKERWAEKQA